MSADLWRSVVSIPTIRGGTFTSADTASIVLELHDVDNNVKRAMEHAVLLPCSGKNELRVVRPPVFVDGTIFTTCSPKQGIVVRFVPVDTDFRVDVHFPSKPSRSFFANKIFKSLLKSPQFQRIAWNSSESRFVFVAEQQAPVVKKMWDPTEPSSTSPFEYRPSWGEAFVDYSTLSLFNCDVVSCTMEPLLDEKFLVDYSATMPEFVNDEDELWFAAVPHAPQRLGLAHCMTRKNIHMQLRKGLCPVPVQQLKQAAAVRNFKRNPLGKNVAYFEAASGCPAHNCCFALKVAEPMDDGWVVAAEVPVQRQVDETTGFPGFYPAAANDIFWVNSDTMLVSSTSFSSVSLFVVKINNTNSLAVHRLELPHKSGTWNILDSRGTLALLSHSATLCAPSIHLFDFSSQSSTRIFSVVNEISSEVFLAFQTEVASVPAAHGSEVLFHFRTPSPSTTRRPVIIVVHGGPHAADTNMFTYGQLFSLLSGFDILSVNYGGSAGFGQERIDQLLGNIGTNDVDDVLLSINHVSSELHWLDLETKLIISGGSHGGWLAAHLSSREPKRFSACIMRNPVIYLPSMALETDIPDWVAAEGGSSFPFPKQLAEMSPYHNAGKVSVPTLLGIGALDQRVPPHQGRAWYNALRHSPLKPKIKLLEYPNDGHALDSVHAMADFNIESMTFLKNVLA